MTTHIDAQKYAVPEEQSTLVWARLGSLAGLAGFMFAPFFYVLGRIRMAQLEGSAVEVTPSNFGFVHERVSAASRAFGVEQMKIRVFVVSEGGYNISRERYGSNRVIIVPGTLLAGGDTPLVRAELDYLIGRFVGAFALRHSRFGPFEFMISARQIPLVGLLLKPWYRATVLTGDRLGMVWSNDAAATFSAMAKVNVGPDAADTYSLQGHIDQAMQVQTNVFHTLAKWRSSYPHMTDRLVALVQFAGACPEVAVPTSPAHGELDVSAAVRAVAGSLPAPPAPPVLPPPPRMAA